ncbi:MAG TPA: sulfite exporter TauE/SafE family protein, partial [Candidatus Hydrogenedentes bacterium]|nr:sulfite exporter TauE/SafE family protein [Candidatus Hydrogenedentota bacterium]
DGHGHEHRHDLVSTARPGYAHILWLGVSGGIVPCPAALIVLLLALKLGQLPYGLALLVAFSAGLAVVLVTVGVLVVRGAQAVRRRAGEQGHIFLVLPVVSAAFITVLGGAVVLWTLIQYGLLDLGA